MIYKINSKENFKKCNYKLEYNLIQFLGLLELIYKFIFNLYKVNQL